MRYFSVAADFKTDTLDSYVKLNEQHADAKIHETFGQITVDNKFGSGRPSDMLPPVGFEQLAHYVEYGNKLGIAFNYVLNSTCLGNQEFSKQGLAQIGDFFGRLEDIHVHAITISMPPLIEFIRKAGFHFEIKASTLCEISNANKAIAYKEMGAGRIVVYEGINRDFRALRSIRDAFGENMEIIANVICYKNCAYRPFHQNQGSHDVEWNAASTRYYSHRCVLQRLKSADNFMKLNWIRPEDIHYYEDIGIHRFKIQGRHSVVNGQPVRSVAHYMDGSYDGNLLELLDHFNPSNSFLFNLDNRMLDNYILPFVQKDGFCRSDCLNCGYCSKWVKSSIREDEIKHMYNTTQELYRSLDDYEQLITEYAIHARGGGH